MNHVIYYPFQLRDLPYGSVVIDGDGDAWQKLEELDIWGIAGFDAGDPDFFIEEFLPVTVVYKPEEA